MSDSKKVSTGFLWLTAQLLATKGAAFFSQFILLQFLAPEDFGLFGLALTVNLLTMVMQSTGIRDLLVTRKRSFARLSKTSFALALLLGMFSTILAIGASPLLVWCYATDRPETLRILILILAIQPLIASFGVVPFSKLNSESRFKEIAILGVVRGMVDSVLRVALAISGMGVLSLVISQVAATLCSTMGAIYLAWPRMTGVVRGFALKKVAIANFSFTAGNFFLAAFEFIDYSILGVFSTGPLVGLYFVAYSLSNQIVFLVVTNAMTVLLPSLSSMPAKSRQQYMAHWRASRLLIATIVPFAFAISAIADWATHNIFPERWHGISPILTILSIGMIFRPTLWLSQNLLKASNESRRRIKVSAVALAMFILIVSVGTIVGDVMGAAIAVGVAYFLITIGVSWLLMKDHVNSLVIVRCILQPFLLGAACFAPLWLVDPTTRALVIPVAWIGYLLLMRLTMQDEFSEFKQVLVRLLGRSSRIPPKTTVNTS